MSRLSEIFRTNKKCFIPFVTAGFPDLERTRDIVIELAQAGAHIVELGIPFSDPIADGPVIQKSSFDALQHGYSLDDFLDLVRQIRRDSGVGLIFMSYLNPLYKYGLERLDDAASRVGLDGILISDLTPEAYCRLGTAFKLDTIFLAAPTSSEERLRRVCAASRGFLYVVARTGVTGAQTDLQTQGPDTVRRIRQHSAIPVAVGFGVTSRGDVEKVWQYADGAIVGSAIVRFIQEHQGDVDLAHRVGQYAKSFLGN